MLQDIALGLLTSNVAAVTGNARLIVDIAMYFGLFVIVAMALNFQYGNAGIPNMGCAVQVIVGGFTVSALTTRLIFTLVEAGGVQLEPWATDFEIIYQGKIGKGTTIYQGSNRYNIDNFTQNQHKLEFKSDNFGTLFECHVFRSHR